MHNSVISMHSFGTSTMTCFGYKQFGWVHVRPPVVSHLRLTGMPSTSRP